MTTQPAGTGRGAAVADLLKKREKECLGRLLEWLRIPSVSTDPAYKADVQRAAEWAAEHLKKSGLNVQIKPTAGHPIVWATNEGEPGSKAPHVLFYGHYDVQPPDPLDLWESPPFEPVIKPAASGPEGKVPGERIVARGAVDDKGQVSTFLEALRGWHDEHGSIPIKLTVLLEGEEESGSTNLEKFVADHHDELAACDICVISDTGMLGRGKPAITYGVRGLAYTEVILHGPNQDLHSGMWGGRCPNPINELCKVLAQLWDNLRQVTIPGFYADVVNPSKEERKRWAELPLDYPEMLENIGIPPDGNIGEEGWTALEREWARPTCDINGIWGGYQGKGAKTVIPAYAGAKVSFRLVANQDPSRITSSFKQWIHDRTPPGCRWEFHDHSGGFPGNVSSKSEYLHAAERAIEHAAGMKPYLIKTGGSIPVVGMLKSRLDLDTILIGFGLDDDRVHSPNEKFELSCFRLGLATHAHLIEEFSRMS